MDDRELWLEFRRILLMLLTTIEDRLEIKPRTSELRNPKKCAKMK
jgi:hypothetical protein